MHKCMLWARSLCAQRNAVQFVHTYFEWIEAMCDVVYDRLAQSSHRIHQQPLQENHGNRRHNTGRDAGPCILCRRWPTLPQLTSNGLKLVHNFQNWDVSILERQIIPEVRIPRYNTLTKQYTIAPAQFHKYFACPAQDPRPLTLTHIAQNLK